MRPPARAPVRPPPWPAPTCGGEALLLEPLLVHRQLDLLASRQPHRVQVRPVKAHLVRAVLPLPRPAGCMGDLRGGGHEGGDRGSSTACHARVWRGGYEWEGMRGGVRRGSTACHSCARPAAGEQSTRMHASKTIPTSCAATHCRWCDAGAWPLAARCPGWRRWWRLQERHARGRGQLLQVRCYCSGWLLPCRALYGTPAVNVVEL